MGFILRRIFNVSITSQECDQGPYHLLFISTEVGHQVVYRIASVKIWGQSVEPLSDLLPLDAAAGLAAEHENTIRHWEPVDVPFKLWSHVKSSARCCPKLLTSLFQVPSPNLIEIARP